MGKHGVRRRRLSRAGTSGYIYPGTLARFRANGVRVLEELPPANGRRVGFLEAPDGVQIEVIEKA
jgi:hypothetical protein